MKTAIFGGSFDPIHNGHMYMARQAMQEFELDRVFLVPSVHSPNKSEYAMQPYDVRYKMCELACKYDKDIFVSDIETTLDADVTYTYLMLKAFHDKYPYDKLYFLMGGDSLDYFETWKNPDIICSYAVLLVAVREEFDFANLSKKISHIKEKFSADIRLLKCDKIDISSTNVRCRLAKDKSIDDLVSKDVLDYILQNNLYKCRR